MAIKLIGTTSGVEQDIQSFLKAARTVGVPYDIGSLGAYSLGANSGTMAAGLAANSEVFQFRWTHATNLMMLRSVAISAGGIVAFAAGFGSFMLRLARSWTADGTGGTAISFATNDQKKRSSFATTSAPSGLGVRIASTAALGAGTKTLDGNDLAVQTFGVTATAGITLGLSNYLWQRNSSDEYPVLFAQNEGFVIRATVPATGTWTLGVTVEWGELASF